MLNVLGFCSLQVAVTRNCQLREAVASLVTRVSPGLLAGEGPETACLMLLLALNNLHRDGNGDTHLDASGQAMSGIADAAPLANATYRKMLTQVCTRLPLRQATTMWPFLLRARARP